MYWQKIWVLLNKIDKIQHKTGLFEILQIIVKIIWINFSDALPSRYMLYSERFIDERTIQRVDRIASSMSENGLYQFYNSFAEFSYKSYISHNNPQSNDGEIPPITMQQFKRMMLFILCLNGSATVVFLAEILIFMWMDWRNRMYIKFDWL